jgi:hypothetical protein
VVAPAPGLLDLIAEESGGTASPAVAAVADAARARHGPGIVAVLLYGSCLREADDRGKIIDLFLIADRYAEVHPGRWMRWLNALLPPNVYYIEAPLKGRVARAKYALITLAQFEKLVSPQAFHPYFWARFAQPTIVVWARDEATRERLQAALAEAATTLIHETLPLVAPHSGAEELWTRAFAETYRTELRAERPDRAAQLYRSFAERYRRVGDAILSELPAGYIEAASQQRTRAVRRWRRRRVLGKFLSVLRLVKNSLTFEDGAAYLAWKIQRHSGVPVDLTPWQRRHPILASSVLFWRLYRAGAFR